MLIDIPQRGERVGGRATELEGQGLLTKWLALDLGATGLQLVPRHGFERAPHATLGFQADHRNRCGKSDPAAISRRVGDIDLP
ncbi:hypothetical protein ACFWXT_29655, partial [Bacillus cereus]|uniref:hypothetical protein n=1 Tax=Bacillus cereus TaxID=1396 RepID=UPI003673477F